MHFKAMLHVIKGLFLAASLLLIMSCEPGNSAKQSTSEHDIQRSKTEKTKQLDPGQTGPNPALLQGNQDTFSLKARRLTSNGPWVVELFQGSERLARWSAISGYNTKPTADRRWSPGNGAALPIGDYLLGQPEPWGTDIWLNLQPTFKTERSGLGIHHCNPGSGCLCIPNRTDLEAIAAWVKATKINKLTVQN
ncbi:MAG: hypothetical protein ISR06_04675 [Synechococcus sp. BS30m-G30]|nr:hypothetical protein [Synechococcus sp.]MBL6888130.1 hypothetical protein [Synechococcus sp. BS30m-G30]